MADDPYSLLGLARTASEDEIKKAFRRLAKELHPDARPNDAVAMDRFKRVSAAYELLSDPDKRKRFDRGEIDASGEPRRTAQRPSWAPSGAGAGAGRARGGVDEDLGGFGDIFENIFGANGRSKTGARSEFVTRGQDVRYTLEVDFLEAASGAKKRVTLPDGGGVLDLSVPEGVTDGQVLRLKGKGAPSVRGAEPGDALIEIKVKAHPQWSRVGEDVELDVPISIDEAILGAKIEVPTISGRVSVTVPKGTNSGTVLKLKGKGIRNPATSSVGDQLVKVRIVLPDTVDESLAYFISEWRQKHGYDPRKRG